MKRRAPRGPRRRASCSSWPACSGLRGPTSGAGSPVSKVPVLLAALAAGSPDSAERGFRGGGSGAVRHGAPREPGRRHLGALQQARHRAEDPRQARHLLDHPEHLPPGGGHLPLVRVPAVSPSSRRASSPRPPSTRSAVSASLRSLAGEALTGDTQFSFRTEPLRSSPSRPRATTSCPRRAGRSSSRSTSPWT